MFQITLIGLLLLTIKGSAQVLQCPGTFPRECRCGNSSSGPLIDCITMTMDTWDIQKSFDAISDAFNNADAVVHSIAINPAMVISPSVEVPAHSISNIKTRTMSLHTDHKFTRIDPNAFSGTYYTTELLSVFDMDFQNSEEAFDLFNNFQALRQLAMNEGITLPQIPAHAFGNHLRSLDHISIQDAGVQSIGYLAFAEPPQLITIILDGNNLTLANISNTAFTVSRTGVYLRLERNPGITHLPEKKFGDFLRANENMIWVGCDFCDPAYLLQCDDRIDWICEAGVTRIYGYLCAETGYVDIYDYCEQKFGNNTLYRRSLEEVKKIQIADHVRHATLKTEEEFRHRSYATNKAKHQHQIHA